MAAKPGWAQVTRYKYELKQETIDQLKQELVDNGFEPKLYKYENDGDVILFRPLMHLDYSVIQSFLKTNEGNVKPDEIDRRICEQAVLWPQEIMAPHMWEVQKAGLQSTLAKQILARSGFLVDELDQTAYMKVEQLTTVEMGPKPTDEAVAELKAKHNWPLRLVQIDTEYFVIRPLNRAEWRALSTNEAADGDLLMAERATVWSREYPTPCNYGERLAGCARTISELVYAISGFGGGSTTVEEL